MIYFFSINKYGLNDTSNEEASRMIECREQKIKDRIAAVRKTKTC